MSENSLELRITGEQKTLSNLFTRGTPSFSKSSSTISRNTENMTPSPVPPVEKALVPSSSDSSDNRERSQRVFSAKTWNKPPVPKPVVGYDKNSMAAMVYNLRQIILARANPPIDRSLCPNDQADMSKFQQKFGVEGNGWTIMMEKMLKIAEIFDNLYSKQHYFGLKTLLAHDFSNIAFSFILIGSQTKAGPGIDNLPNQELPPEYGRLTIQQQVSFFFQKLYIAMEQIAETDREITALDREHSDLLNLEGKCASLVQTLVKNIKLQEKELSEDQADPQTYIKELKNAWVEKMKGNIENDSSWDASDLAESEATEEDKIREAKIESLGDNWQAHKLAQKELGRLQQKIGEIVVEKTKKNHKIAVDWYKVTTIIQFNYLMHTNYCPPLDHGMHNLIGS